MTDQPLNVARARIEEVKPLAAEYRQEALNSETTMEPPLPTGALFWLASTAQREAVGYAAGTLRPEGLLLGPVFVRPAQRRSGVAMQLLKEIERWAQTSRIPLVEVSVAVDNEAGIRFLEGAGYRTRRLLMAREDAPEGVQR